MVSFIKRTLLFGMFIFWQISAYAADDAAAVLNRLLANISTMQADFSQTLKDAKTTKPLQTATGKMALERPGKFRWEVLRPTPQLVVANGERLWIYDPDLEQVTIRLISKETGETPALLLSNTEATLTKHFSVRKYPDKAGQQWFHLTPNNSNAMLAAITLGFIQDKLATMILTDHLGHMTVIEFKKVTVNTALGANLFQFKIPHDVDVIDETHQ